MSVGIETGAGTVPSAAAGMLKGALPVALPRADPRVNSAGLEFTIPAVLTGCRAAGVPNFLVVGAAPGVHTALAAGPFTGEDAENFRVGEAAGPGAGPVGGVTASPAAHLAIGFVDESSGQPGVLEGVDVGGHVGLDDEQFTRLSSLQIPTANAGVGILVTGCPVDAEGRVVGALIRGDLPVLATSALPRVDSFVQDFI